MSHIELLTSPLGPNEVTTTTIKNLAVTEPKIATEAVSQEKIKKATIPATGAGEGEFGLGSGGGGRSLIANLNAKAEAGPYTFKHQQASLCPILFAFNKTKNASSTVTWEVVTNNEVKFTLGTAPAAKDEVLIYVLT